MNFCTKRGRTLIVVPILGITLSGCLGGGETLDPLFLPGALEKEGWAFIGLASSRYAPGSIVTIEDGGGLRFRGSLPECVPEEELRFEDPADTNLAGTISASKGVNFNAFVSLIGVVGVDGGANRASSVKISVDQSQIHSVSEISVSEAISNHANTMSTTCRHFIFGTPAEISQGAKQRFILTNLLAVKGYTFTFQDERGANINVDASNIGNFIQFGSDQQFVPKAGGGFSIGSSADGELGTQNWVFLAFQGGPAVVTDSPLGAEATTAETLQQALMRIRDEEPVTE